jgi:hypothetical protein
MIRQAISCDICGAEKKQTNHWFVAHAHAGELRVSGWKANGRMRAGAKHLCGQTCLHKLLDEFIAGTVSNRVPAAADASEAAPPIAATHLASASIAALAASPTPAAPIPAPSAPVRSLQVMPATLIAIAPSRPVDPSAPPASAFDDQPSYPSRRWRAEAWERERERERRATLNTHRKTS